MNGKVIMAGATRGNDRVMDDEVVDERMKLGRRPRGSKATSAKLLDHCTGTCSAVAGRSGLGSLVQ